MSTTPTVHPIPMNWKETPEAHVFVADLPGFSKKDVRVEFIDDMFLVVNAERKWDIDYNDSWHMMDRETGKFQRKIELPEMVPPRKLHAWLENGVLTLCIPKK